MTEVDFSNDRPATVPVMADRLLKLQEVMQIVSLRKTKIYQLKNDGKFPAPLKPGGHASRWSEREVYEWLAALSAERKTLH